MSLRHASSCAFLVFLAAALIFGLMGARLSSEDPPTQEVLIPGRNVNMVSGTTLPGGDPWLQRQNEPSIAVSTRNPLHLLAGANDYRTVDMAFSEGNLPGKAQGAMAGDAWVGIYKSFDGGESWVTSLIHGFPQDQSVEGSASPLKQFSTAADPIVRAGTNGLFYYSGMAFNRAQEKGGGSIFLTRFIDNNNVEDVLNGDPIKYLDTRIIDLGTAGQFIDMPRIATDIPRGSGTVTIDGQTIPRANVYCAYTVFLGNTDINVRSRILFRRSTDCGATWSSAIKISESQHIIQGATFAIDPRNGTIYLAFRRFLHLSQTDSIVVAKSTDFGQTFSPPVVIANITPFDQPATDMLGDNISDPAGPSFRTNSYPTMTVDKNGIVYGAWTERGHGPAGAARIVLSTSQDGSGWTSPAAIVDVGDPNYQGHQFMPSLTYAQGKLVLIWYDQRYDEYGLQFGVGNWIGDNMPIRHTTDVRCAQAGPGLFPVFQPSVQVSKYLWALSPGSDNEIEQEQYNPPNYEMFKGGTTPFHGDYIEVTAAPPFVLGPAGWTYNTEPSKNPVFHAIWTDNRDVRPPADGNWANYTPPASAQGVFGSKLCGSVNLEGLGMRNQNIYTSTFVRGIAAASPGNSKTLGDLGDYYDEENGLIPRAFVVYVKNPGSEVKVFRLSIDPEPSGVDGSFLEFEDLESLDVMIAPFSTVARTVFVRSSVANASITLAVIEIDDLGGEPVPDGLVASVALNPDSTSPSYAPADEYHNPNIRNPNIVNWDELNPNIVNPNIRNPNIRNWDELNPNIVNPNIRNPNIVNPNIRNLNVVNPNIRNPNIVNPNIVNPNIRNYTEPDFDGAEVSDAEFAVKNDGNTTSTYTLKLYSKESLPDEVFAQLLLYRVHYTPAADYYQQTGQPCELKKERHHELLLNVTNPNIRNPNIVNPNIRNPNIRNGGLDNATFAVAPGEEVEAVLRVIDFNPGAQGQFRIMETGQAFSVQSFVDSIGFAATAHALNTDEARTVEEEKLTPKSSATKLIISTSSLPYGIMGMAYSAMLTAEGGSSSYAWSLNSGELPPGLSLNVSGLISGTPTAAGLFHFIVRVDSGGDFDTQKFSIYVDADGTADPLTITTATLPGGVLNVWYGAALEATGGVWPLTWSLASGKLPAGLSLDSNGVISGTIQLEPGQDPPTTYNFTVVVADSTGSSTDTQALAITVNINTGQYFTISGTVYDDLDQPLPGTVMRGLPNTPVTNANGTYEDTVPENWAGTATPFNGDVVFDPPSRTYSQVAGSFSQQDYNVPSGGLTYMVSGTVYYSTSTLDGIKVDLMQGIPPTWVEAKTTTTAGRGSYTFTAVAPGTYYVRVNAPAPEYIGWTATPVTITSSDVTRDMDLPKIIDLLTPPSGAIVNTQHPLLTWTANPQASRYVVQINQTNNWDPAIEQTTVPTNSYTVQTTLTYGTSYTWQVDAYDAATPVNHSVGTTNTAFTFTPAPPPVSGEIGIRQGPIGIPTGRTYHFGPRANDSHTSAVFTIENTGAGDLALNGDPLIALSGADAGQFQITASPSSPVPAESSSAFTIQFSPTSLGLKTATISIANGDADENPYIVNLIGDCTTGLIFSDFNQDGVDQAPPLSGLPTHPTGLIQLTDGPGGPSVDGTINVRSAVNGLTSRAVEINGQGFATYYWGTLVYDLETPISSGTVIFETTMAVNTLLASADYGFFSETGSSTNNTVARLWIYGGAIKGGKNGAVQVGTYQANIPFRVRAIINLDAQTWSAVVDNEMNGFDDDTGYPGLTFENTFLLNIQRIYAGSCPFNIHQAFSCAYDDIYVGYVPTGGGQARLMESPHPLNGSLKDHDILGQQESYEYAALDLGLNRMIDRIVRFNPLLAIKERYGAAQSK